MRKIVLLLALAGVFYAHARYTFSENAVMSWMTKHAAKAMSGDTSACDDYADDVEVDLVADGRRGRWEVEGGKAEMCGYLKQAAAAYTVLQASTRTEFDAVRVTPGGFPWTHAKLSYVQRTTLQIPNLPSMTVESEDTVELVRGFGGLKIKSVESRSHGGL